VYQRILEIQPEDPEAKNALGLVPKPPSLAPQEAKKRPDRKTAPAPAQKTESTASKPDNDKFEQVEKLLTETEVYIKYGLHDKAVEHLNKILKIDASSIKVYEKLKEIHIKADEHEPAVHAVTNIIRLHKSNGNEQGAQNARASLARLKPDHPATDPGFNFTEAFEEDFDVDMSTGAFEVSEVEKELGSGSPEGLEIDFGTETDASEEDEFFEVSNFDLDFDTNADDQDKAYQEEDDGNEQLDHDISTISFDAEGSPLVNTELVNKAVAANTMETPIAELPSESQSKDIIVESDLDLAAELLGQNALDEAQELIANVLEKAPANLRAIELQNRHVLLAAGQTNEAMGAHIHDAMKNAESGDLNLPSSIGTGQPISDDDSFMTAAKEITDADEAELESRFDLGLAYREMGMLEEAIIEFQIASQASSKTLESYTLIGRCFMEQGDSISAVGYFFNAIESGASEELATELKYEIGNAYETANDPDLALHWYETVHDENPQFKDVQAKITALGGSLESTAVQAGGQ